MQICEISTGALAYLGDSVLELQTRNMLVQKGISDAGKLNKEALTFVSAKNQALAFDKMLPTLTEEENSVAKRGRNHHPSNIPKSASYAEYSKATAMEALFGYLYLSGKTERIRELFDTAYGINTEK